MAATGRALDWFRDDDRRRRGRDGRAPRGGRRDAAGRRRARLPARTSPASARRSGTRRPRGVVRRADAGHRRGHLARAILEARPSRSATSPSRCSRPASEVDGDARVRRTGAQRAWNQVKADVTGFRGRWSRRCSRRRSLGSAILGAVGIGAWPDLRVGDPRHDPDRPPTRATSRAAPRPTTACSRRTRRSTRRSRPILRPLAGVRA